jgi:elongation factor Ts
MANISAKDVAELRKQTGCGMMECKKALVEAEGNFQKAVKVLREKGMAVAAKKQDRIAAEGVVAVLSNENGTAMIEVNSETDFVAKNESFQEFVNDVLKVILATRPADVDTLLAAKFNDEFTVEGALKDKIFQIGEKLTIRRFVIVDGITSTYIHGKGATGVVVKFVADDAAANNAGFAEYAKNIALQVAAYPTQYVNIEDVPAEVVNAEKEVLIAQIKNDPKNAKKPENIIEKMVVGKMGKFYEANCLVQQGYVKEDSMTVAQYTDACAKEFGGAIRIDSFYRYEKGEGLQKREENFAEEIAKLVQ